MLGQGKGGTQEEDQLQGNEDEDDRFRGSKRLTLLLQIIVFEKEERRKNSDLSQPGHILLGITFRLGQHGGPRR